MKKKENFKNPAYYKLLFTVAVIAALLAVFSACGKNGIDMDTSSQIASPPPPPSPGELQTKDSVYTIVDELPEFHNGMAGLMKYIADSTVYPEEAKINNITGKVIVNFVVGKDCSISKIGLTKRADPLLDAEAIRVVSSLPDFEKPAKNNGTAVSVQFNLPINFTLQ